VGESETVAGALSIGWVTVEVIEFMTAAIRARVFSRMATRSDSALFSDTRRSSSEDGPDGPADSSCLTSSPEGGGATDDRLTPELTIVGGIPS
jgi:hypothetical protein